MSRYWNELLVSCYRKRNLWYLPPANTSTLSDLIPRSSSYGAILQIGNRHATPVLMLSFYAHLSLTTGQCGATPQRSAANILFARTGRFHIELDIVNASIMHSLFEEQSHHQIKICGAQDRFLQRMQWAPFFVWSLFKESHRTLNSKHFFWRTAHQ